MALNQFGSFLKPLPVFSGFSCKRSQYLLYVCFTMYTTGPWSSVKQGTMLLVQVTSSCNNMQNKSIKFSCTYMAAIKTAC